MILKHLFFTLPIIFAALLFMGAGRIREQVRTRNDIIKETRNFCSRELELLATCLPEEERKEWVHLAREVPVTLLQATSPGYSPLPVTSSPMSGNL